MPVVTIMPSGAKVEAAEGTSLLAAIKAAGHTIGNKCDGNADCGTCHIFVLEGRKGISRSALPRMRSLTPLWESVRSPGWPARRCSRTKTSRWNYSTSRRAFDTSLAASLTLAGNAPREETYHADLDSCSLFARRHCHRDWRPARGRRCAGMVRSPFAHRRQRLSGAVWGPRRVSC